MTQHSNTCEAERGRLNERNEGTHIGNFSVAFLEKGYSALLIRDICKEIAIKESSVYYHFQNKQAIFDELLHRFLDKAQGLMAEFSTKMPYASRKGVLEALAKCLKVEYAHKSIAVHLFHPPLTQTKSTEPLPAPKEFKAPLETVDHGLTNNIHSNELLEN